MDPDVAERAKRSIQEYAQRNSAMGREQEFQGIQLGNGQISSTTMCYIFEERKNQLAQSYNKEGFIYLDQVLIMYEMVYPSTSRSS